jgi:GntR family transcriptional regulator/MocR family aminotransferase
VFKAAQSVSTHHPPMLGQAVLCDFLTEGHFARHIRRMRQIYAERLAILLESAKQQLSGALEISSVEAGLQTVGWLPKGVDAERVAKAAEAQGVEVVPLRRYAWGKSPGNGLIFGFAAFDPREIRDGAERLARVLERKGNDGTSVPRQIPRRAGENARSSG